MVHELQNAREAVDERLAASRLSLFHGAGAAESPAGTSAGAARSVEDGYGSDASGSDDEDGAFESDESEGGSDADESDSEDESDGDEGKAGRTSRSADAGERRPLDWQLGGGMHGDDETAQSQKDTVRRLRQRALTPSSDPGASSSDDDSGGSSGDEGGSDADAAAEGDSSGDEGEEYARWRDRTLAKQAALFSTRAGDLRRLVYSRAATVDGGGGGPLGAAGARGGGSAATAAGAHAEQSSMQRADHDDGASGSDSDDTGELFTLKRRAVASGGNHDAQAGTPAATNDDIDAVDSPLPTAAGVATIGGRSGGASPSEWLREDGAAIEALRVRFVTGGAAAFAGQRRRAAARGEGGASGDEDSEDGSEVFGDFEDMEAAALAGAALLHCRQRTSGTCSTLPPCTRPRHGRCAKEYLCKSLVACRQH